MILMGEKSVRICVDVVVRKVDERGECVVFLGKCWWDFKVYM